MPAVDDEVKSFVLFVEDEKNVREHIVRTLSDEFLMEGAETAKPR